jgi:hypothetical protein
MSPPLKQDTGADTIDKRACERAYQRALKNKRRPQGENQRLLKSLAAAIDVYGKDLIREADVSTTGRRSARSVSVERVDG